jgi:hypothetical protein
LKRSDPSTGKTPPFSAIGARFSQKNSWLKCPPPLNFIPYERSTYFT